LSQLSRNVIRLSQLSRNGVCLSQLIGELKF